MNQRSKMKEHANDLLISHYLYSFEKNDLGIEQVTGYTKYTKQEYTELKKERGSGKC